MFPSGSNFQNETMQNTANMSLAFMAFTPVFGNMNFIITPPNSMIPGKPDQVQAGFPSIPYFPLEGALYQGQTSNPMVAPPNILTGNTAGSQSIKGQQSITNGNGQQVYTAGYSASGF